MFRVAPQLLLLYGAVASIVGAFMPWHQIGPTTRTGVELAGVPVVVVPFVVMALAVWGLVRGRIGLVASAISGVIGIVGISIFIEVLTEGPEVVQRPAWTLHEYGHGFFLSIGGSGLITLGAALRILSPGVTSKADEASAPPSRGAALSRAFLIASLCVASLSAVGVETHVLLAAGHYVYAPLLIAAYGVMGLWLRRPRRRGRARGAANPAVEAFVRLRAEALRVSKPFAVVVLQRTADQRNAYVQMTHKADLELVLCEGVEVLYFTNRAAFRFIIDHELGHVAANDVHLLQSARGFIFATLFALPAKVVAAAQLSQHYRVLFPTVSRATHPGVAVVNEVGQYTTLDWTIPGAEFLDRQQVTSAVIFLSLALLILVCALYVAAVRLREYWADRFAHAVSPTPDKDWDLLAEIVRSDSPRGGLFHPGVRSRLNRLATRVLPHVAFWGMADLLLVTSLLAFRFGLGNSGMGFELPGAVAVVLSLAFYGVFYLAVSLVIEDFAETRLASPRHRLSVRLAIIAVIGALAGILVAFALRHFLSGEPTEVVVRSYGLDHLNRAQMMEYGALALSVPIAALVCAGGALLVEAPLRRRSKIDATAARAVGALGAAAMLCAIGVVGERVMRRLGADELRSYRMAFLAQRETERRLPADLLSEKRLSKPDDIATRLLYVSYDYQALCVPAARFSRHYFAPPMALFDVSQSPLRVNPFDTPDPEDLDRVADMLRVFLMSGSRSLEGGLTYAEFVEHVENLGRFDCDYFDAVTRLVKQSERAD